MLFYWRLHYWLINQLNSVVCLSNWSFTVKIDFYACSGKHVVKLFHYLVWCSQRILCWWTNIRLRRSKMLSLEIKLLNYYSWSKIKKCRYNSETWQFRLCRLVLYIYTYFSSNDRTRVCMRLNWWSLLQTLVWRGDFSWSKTIANCQSYVDTCITVS